MTRSKEIIITPVASHAAVQRALYLNRLSLSVNNQNPAGRLYESVGYDTVADDGVSLIMVLQL